MVMAKHRNADQILYCERCGISFLWSTEEQAAHDEASQLAAGKKPTHCPGCRELLPAQNRERGIVAWFNYRKHFGFITRKDGDDLFVHRSEIPRKTRLKTGDLVEFTRQRGPRGAYASDVKLLIPPEQAVDASGQELV